MHWAASHKTWFIFDRHHLVLQFDLNLVSRLSFTSFTLTLEKWAGWDVKLKTAFTAIIKALIKCVRTVSVLHLNKTHKFSPQTSLPVPLPTLGHMR